MNASSDSAARASKVQPTLRQRNAPLASAQRQIAVLDELALRDADFDRHLERAGLFPLRATGIEIFQLNVGKVCNQTCAHCHVDAGPDRTESMTRDTAELAMRVFASTEIPTLDITGGAPELNANFEWLVREARKLGRRVIDRCNLTVLQSARLAHLPQFFAEQCVEVVCSLPHYRALNTDRQRGEGVFERSIAALRALNTVGYGREGTGLKLVLVTNPVGAFLPPSQSSLTAEWQRELKRLHDVEFNELYTITNMPISRYLEWLANTGNLASYMQLLVDSFNPRAAAGVMCRNTLSVGWDGRLFDCDFNQMLELETAFGAPRHLRDFDLATLAHRRIATARHCFGCSAGAGSSCGGAVV